MFSAQQNQFWNGPNTSTFQTRAGLLSAPSDWFVDRTDYAELTYTHTLPGNWRWLSVTIGQYGFGAYDGNQYAGNAQTNFVNYALAQNGTQTYPTAGLGAYAQATAPENNLLFAAGVQGATNLSGSTITTGGLGSDKRAYFLAAQWTSNLLASGSYGVHRRATPNGSLRSIIPTRFLKVCGSRPISNSTRTRRCRRPPARRRSSPCAPRPPSDIPPDIPGDQRADPRPVDLIELFRCRFLLHYGSMIYGYAFTAMRVSTAAQDESGQVAQLRAAGCGKVLR